MTSVRKDSDVVSLFLHGHPDLNKEKNILIYKMAMTFIKGYHSQYFILPTQRIACNFSLGQCKAWPFNKASAKHGLLIFREFMVNFWWSSKFDMVY